MTSSAGKETIAASIFQAFSSYKSKIEDRSSFRSSETSVEQSNSNASIALKKVEFCIQIATSSKPRDTHPNNFNNYKDVERIQISADNFKYIVGRTTDYATAQETLKKVKADFVDAFLVSIIDDNIHPVSKGLKLISD